MCTCVSTWVCERGVCGCVGVSVCVCVGCAGVCVWGGGGWVCVCACECINLMSTCRHEKVRNGMVLTATSTRHTHTRQKHGRQSEAS